MQNSKMAYIKSLNSLVRELISNLELRMFAPQQMSDINNLISICNQFKTVFTKNNAFWELYPKSSFLTLTENWCLLNIKSRNPNLDIITICFCFEENKLRIIVSDNVSLALKGQENSAEHLLEQKFVLYNDIMTDHERLVKILPPIFERAIHFANREDAIEPYPNNTTILEKELESVD